MFVHVVSWCCHNPACAVLICSVLCVYKYQFDVHERTGGFQDEAESMDVGELISRCNVEEARYLIEHCLQLTIERVMCVCVCCLHVHVVCVCCIHVHVMWCVCVCCICMLCVLLFVSVHVFVCVCMWFCCCCFVPVFFVLFLSLSASIGVVLFLSLSTCIVPVPGFFVPFLDLFFVSLCLWSFPHSCPYFLCLVRMPMFFVLFWPCAFNKTIKSKY